MIDPVFAEIAGPDGEGDWCEATRRRSESARRVLARHSWAIGLMESRTDLGPANLHHREAAVACLRKAGFSIEMTAHANWLLDSYVDGFVLQEASLPFDSAEAPSAMGDEVFLPQVPPEQYPYLHESAAALLAIGYDPADELPFGLDVVLDALERLRAPT
jgi:hypothetical protein